MFRATARAVGVTLCCLALLSGCPKRKEGAAEPDASPAPTTGALASATAEDEPETPPVTEDSVSAPPGAASAASAVHKGNYKKTLSEIESKYR